jgi:hypothetical protein
VRGLLICLGKMCDIDIVVRKHQWKKSLDRVKHRWRDYIKVYIKSHEGVNWINVPKNRFQWQYTVPYKQHFGCIAE